MLYIKVCVFVYVCVCVKKKEIKFMVYNNAGYKPQCVLFLKNSLKKLCIYGKLFLIKGIFENNDLKRSKDCKNLILKLCLDKGTFSCCNIFFFLLIYCF